MLSVVVSFEHSSNLGEVSRVRDEDGELLAHALLSKLEETVELSPELLLSGGRSLLGELNEAETESLEDLKGGLVASVMLKVCQLASFSEDQQVESGVAGGTNELLESISSSIVDLTRVTGLNELHLEDVITVVLPDTLEVGLVWESRRHLVGKDHVLLLDDLGGELTKSFVLSLESSGALRGSGIQAEHDVGVLVGMGERVKLAIALGIVILGEDVTLVSLPRHLGHFVVEETGTVSSEPVLESEPLEGVRLLTLTMELLGGPFGFKIVHGVLPRLSGVGINVPTVLVLVLSPIGDFETLEDGSGTTVEGNVTDALKKSVWVEVLSVDVMHHIRLLVELVTVYILDTETYIIIKIKISTCIGETRQNQT